MIDLTRSRGQFPFQLSSSLGHLGWCYGWLATLENLCKWIRVSLGASFIRTHVISKQNTLKIKDASSGVIMSELDLQTFKSEFESQRVPHSYGLEPYLSKTISKCQVVKLLIDLRLCVTWYDIITSISQICVSISSSFIFSMRP